MKRVGLISSVLTVLICLTLIVGSTFALFTSEYKVSVSVTSANVDLVATVDDTSLKTWSYNQTEADAQDGELVNGGLASIEDEKSLVLQRFTPGDTVKFNINLENKSDISIKYRVKMVSTGVENYVDLTPALAVTVIIGQTEYSLNSTTPETPYISATANEVLGPVTVVITFPDADDNNDYKTAKAEIVFTIEAIQGNGVA